MTQHLDIAKLASGPVLETTSSDSVELSTTRLGIAAAISAVLHLIYTVLYRTVWVESSNVIGFVNGILGTVVSVAAAAYLFRRQPSAARVVTVGVAYEVFLALVLGMSESSSANYSLLSAQVSWSAIIIVLFPFLMPARPRVILMASLLAALMTPLAMGITFTITDRHWPTAAVTASFVLPPFMCAVLAWAPSTMIYQLTSAVREARRLGSYELSERLGAGGMGEVWRANHRLLARPAAVKLIKPEVLGAKDAQSREALLRRFEKEAQVTANLDSPHTVELYDFGISREGALFYVMELLHGLDVETLVERFGPLPSERVVHLLLQACDSLADAHGRGLIHRDIKPANLFVSRKGSVVDFVKLLDFGLVKRWTKVADDELVKSLENAPTLLQQTAFGQIVGTPAFLAPEAVLGEQAVDHRVDIYALGCVAYWMLTASLVFKETTLVGMAAAHVAREPEPPSQRASVAIVPELESIVMQCLNKDRERRPESAEALRQQLTQVPLREPWTRERACAWWAEHLPVSVQA